MKTEPSVVEAVRPQSVTIYEIVEFLDVMAEVRVPQHQVLEEVVLNAGVDPGRRGDCHNRRGNGGPICPSATDFKSAAGAHAERGPSAHKHEPQASDEEFDLTDDERTALHSSAASVQELIDVMANAG